ncbi:MAG: hypothetical protein ACI85F_000660 [Bacteroidia bacterium]|jgi:hypothetical protein
MTFNQMKKFENFPANSKVWIYQCERALTTDEVDFILNIGNEFSSQWASHGAPVNGAIDVLYNRFVVVVAEDSGQIGGCSIDTSVGVIRKAQATLSVDFFDRMTLAYLASDSVEAVHVNKLDEAVGEGLLGAKTTVFNNTVTDLTGLRNDWMIPLEKSWAWGRVSTHA